MHALQSAISSRPGCRISLVDAVEANSSRRWKTWDFEELSIDASTARRQFQKCSTGFKSGQGSVL